MVIIAFHQVFFGNFYNLFLLLGFPLDLKSCFYKNSLSSSIF